ncbi:MAG: Methyltransferase type 11, partial [Acidimicrobiia bacterium]|nr:Methyltransferase type 11 [Acidimicrobiia bacterium]
SQTVLLPWTLEDVDLGEHLLEIGPGPGLTTDFLRQRAVRVTAVEIDGALAAALAARLAGTNVEVIAADATATGLAAGSCSSAVCFTMLHHVPSAEEQDRLFAEVSRVLRRGGVFLGTDSVDSELVRGGHVDDISTRVDPDTLGDRLRAAGFVDPVVEQRDHRFRFSA